MNDKQNDRDKTIIMEKVHTHLSKKHCGYYLIDSFSTKISPCNFNLDYSQSKLADMETYCT